MQSRPSTALIALGAFAVVAAIFALESYRWNECRGVGHGVLWCALHVGQP